MNSFLFIALAIFCAYGQNFGEALSDKEITALKHVLESPAKYHQKKVKTEGVIKAVCAKKGCWITLEEAGKTVRVKFKDYAFFLPKDASGKKVILEGFFIDTSQVKKGKECCSKEGAHNEHAYQKPSVEYKFVAEAVRLI